ERGSYTRSPAAVNAVLNIGVRSIVYLSGLIIPLLFGRDRIRRGDVGNGLRLAVRANGDLAGGEPQAPSWSDPKLYRLAAPSAGGKPAAPGSRAPTPLRS